MAPNSSITKDLITLGLSPDEARSYVYLIENQASTAKDIALELQILPNAVYRLMQQLEKRKFVVTLNIHPQRFQAIPPSVAIDSFIDNQKQLLEKIKIKAIASLSQHKKQTSETRIDTVIGQKGVFDKFVELSRQVEVELLIISIGEPVPDDIRLAIRDSRQRGVDIKFLVHKYDKENHELLMAWKKMGLSVRYYSDWGYHLIIFDKKMSLLATNNPTNTIERTGLVIYNKALSSSLRDYFYSLWEKAVEVI